MIKKVVLFVLLFGIMIVGVGAYCDVVSSDDFVGMSFSDLYYNSDVSLDDYFVNKNSITFYHSMNVISRGDNFTYCNDRKTFVSDLDFDVINECMIHNSSQECVNLLVNNNNPFEYVVNGYNIVVEPIDYIVRKNVMEEIDYMQRIQRQAEYNSFLGMIMSVPVHNLDNINSIQEWVQPSNPQSAYGVGAVVSHNNNIWTSNHPHNMWEPSEYASSHWDMETNNVINPVYPEWVQPLGYGDCYGLGAIVWHNNILWVNTHPCNVWEPTGQNNSHWEVYDE